MTQPAMPFPPPQPRSGWRRRGHELAERGAQLSRRAEELLGTDAGPAERHAEPAELVEALTLACAGRLRSGPRGGGHGAAIAALAGDLQRLASELSEHALVARARRLTECERGLARLREITTSAGLIDGVCDELIRSLGFERTMLARVEHGMWRPWMANREMRGEAWVPEWIERAIPLDELTLETQMLSDRRPALVVDTNAPGIAQMVLAAGVTSYVAAPIMPSGQVVGFFHADHGPAGRRCDVADRDLLWTFAEGFGHLYERTALFEQLSTRREQVRRTLSTVEEAMVELTESALELAPDPDGDAGPSPGLPIVREGASARLEALTPRELEVLELIVAGARNQEIAERLVITVGTVKSHVKNILAKLGVVNRSQAIAHYLGVVAEPR